MTEVKAAPAVTEDPYAPTVWGVPKSINEKDLVLPSGQRCRVRELEMEQVLELDLIDALDTFTGQLSDDGTPVEEVAEKSFLDFLKNKPQREKFLETMDKVIPVVVVAPFVNPNPPKGRAKNPNKVYVSDISLQDKMSIFSSVFSGFGEVSKFREEQEEGVGDLAESQGLPHDAE